MRPTCAVSLPVLTSPNSRKTAIQNAKKNYIKTLTIAASVQAEITETLNKSFWRITMENNLALPQDVSVNKCTDSLIDAL